MARFRTVKRRDVQIHQLPIDPMDSLVIDSEPFRDTGPEIVNDNIGRFNQPIEYVPSWIGFHIQNQAAFAQADFHREPVVNPRAEVRVGRVDLDDIGAVFRECTGARPPGQDVRKIEDANPFKDRSV